MTEITKRASWLELFYDLAFVALVAQLTYLAAAHHHSATDVLNIFLLGYMIFIAWWGTTANRNLQDTEDTADRLMIQAQMGGAFLMSITMPGVFEGEVGLFVATFALVRGLQILTMLLTFRQNPERKPKTQNILQGVAIATGLWILAGLVVYPYGYVFAGCALLLDILVTQTKGKGNIVQLLNVHHLQERLGLFLILVMGESMLVVALANTAVSAGVTTPLLILSGLVLMISLWWIYFVHLEMLGEGVRPQNLWLYIHGHAFLFGSIILLAAGYKNMIKHGTPEMADFILVTAGLIGMVVTQAVIRNALHGRVRRLTYLCGVVAVLISLVAFAAVQTAMLAVGIAVYTGLMALMALIDARGIMRQL